MGYANCSDNSLLSILLPLTIIIIISIIFGVIIMVVVIVVVIIIIIIVIIVIVIVIVIVSVINWITITLSLNSSDNPFSPRHPYPAAKGMTQKLFSVTNMTHKGVKSSHILDQLYSSEVTF